MESLFCIVGSQFAQVQLTADAASRLRLSLLDNGWFNDGLGLIQRASTSLWLESQLVWGSAPDILILCGYSMFPQELVKFGVLTNAGRPVDKTIIK